MCKDPCCYALGEQGVAPSVRLPEFVTPLDLHRLCRRGMTGVSTMVGTTTTATAVICVNSKVMVRMGRQKAKC